MCCILFATIVGSFCADVVNNEENVKQQPIKESQPQKRDIGIGAYSDCDTPSLHGLGLESGIGSGIASGIGLGIHSHGYAPSYGGAYSSAYAPSYASSYGGGYLSSGLGKLFVN